MSKKLLIPLIIVLALILVAGSIFFIIKGKNTAPAAATKRPPINEPVNVIDLVERPYITLTPRTDGRELTFYVANLPKIASDMEYELEYQAGTLLQGAFGSIDFAAEKPPVSKKILLGSCSAGGACSFHEDVQGGSITMQFRGQPNYGLKDEWRFLPTKGAKGKFASRDSKFQVSAAKVLDNSAFLIIMQTSGLPAAAPGQVLAGPYGIYPSSGLPSKGELDLTMRLSADSDTATIYGFDGGNWVKFDTKVADKEATATVDPLELFIAVK